MFCFGKGLVAYSTGQFLDPGWCCLPHHATTVWVNADSVCNMIDGVYQLDNNVVYNRGTREARKTKREFRGWDILWGTWQPPEIGLGLSPFGNLLIRSTSSLQSTLHGWYRSLEGTKQVQTTGYGRVRINSDSKKTFPMFESQRHHHRTCRSRLELYHIISQLCGD